MLVEDIDALGNAELVTIGGKYNALEVRADKYFNGMSLADIAEDEEFIR